MVTLLELPDELLLQIIYCLHGDGKNSNAGPRFFRWAKYAQAAASTQSKRNGNLVPLLRTCHQFRAMVTPILYQEVSLNFVHRRLTLFTCIRETRIPSQHTKIIHAAVSDARIQLVPLFSLASIQSLTIDSFNSFTALSHPETYYGNSNVTTLRLSNCGAPEHVLTGLLRYPRALKELAIDSDQESWHGTYSGLAARFSTAALARVCSVQAHSIQTLTLTHAQPLLKFEPNVHLQVGSRIDLSVFKVLKNIKISYDILLGDDEDNDVYKSLPPSLVSLEVHKDVMWGHPPKLLHALLERKSWVERIAENKPTELPHLKEIGLMATDYGVFEGDDVTKFAAIIKALTVDLGDVEVIFSVSLNL